MSLGKGPTNFFNNATNGRNILNESKSVPSPAHFYNQTIQNRKHKIGVSWSQNIPNRTIYPTLCEAMKFAKLLALLLSAASLFQHAISQQGCDSKKIRPDPFTHKNKYTVGVYAISSLNDAYLETHKAFGDYLTATAGQQFDPPIEFEVVSSYFSGILDAIGKDEMHFLYANPGVYSCVGTQLGATALATVINRASTRGQTFDLDVYGGVVAVRYDNDGINSIEDLKDKIIGAGSIIDLMGGQLEFYDMEMAGMSYVNDPKQVVFTKDEFDVVHGVLSGRFDVGFVRTNQIELTLDAEGNPIDPSLFKIIDPKTYIMENGDFFPFLHSTEILPEYPFAALPGVPEDVQFAVQNALFDFGDYATIGDYVNECMAQNETNCNALSFHQAVPNPPCNTSTAMALLASEAAIAGHFAGFRTAHSYFDLRSIQEEGGFLFQDANNNWACTPPDNVYQGITCPDGYFKRNEQEFLGGCPHVGLNCSDKPTYQCFCKPCVKAHEVDVYYHKKGESDPHLVPFYGEALPGCDKMAICGTIQQGQSITMRIFDNLERHGAHVEVIAHAGNSQQNLTVTNLTESYAYEFTVWDNVVQVHIIEILVNGQPISESPVQVVVEPKNCKALLGVGSHRVPDKYGNCVCAGNTFATGGICMESPFFFLIIFSAVFLVLGFFVFFYLGFKKQQSDSVWHISVDELHFNEPPEVIGQGGFGVVILGQYRGTKVAVKRVLPPTKARSGSSSLRSGKIEGMESGEVMAVTTGTNQEEGSTKATSKGKDKDKDNAKDQNKAVKFGGESGDVESQSFSKSGSHHLRGTSSGSNTDWERLLMMRHSGNDILKIMESATSSDHGSGGVLDGSTTSMSNAMMRCLPIWLRYDEHSKRVNEFVNEMRLLSRLRHPCITTVMGAVVHSHIDPMLVMEYMEYGSLYDLLHNETMTPGGEIILQVVRDIVQGIQFLHASKPPILHGDLKAKNILVDSRFRAKVADFGFSHIKTAKIGNVLRGTPFYMAPEYLRRRSEYTTACDIYSLAMIIYEIYARAAPFEGEDPRKILPKVCHPRLHKRPPIPESCPPKMAELMKKCWSANAFFRPTAKDIDYVLVEMNSRDSEPLEKTKGSIRDNVKRKPTSLYDVFPKHIADALNAGKKVEAEAHEIVTIVFSDIVGFTSISQQFSALKVSDMLDRLYRAFDELSHKHNIFKVETIGDAYMCVTNLEDNQFDTHAKLAAEYAQDAVRAASQVLIDEEYPSRGYVKIRIGIHSGPVVTNVIGSLNPRYGLFGDTVNTASRMESNSMPGKIHCSFATAELLKTQAPDIPITLRGMIKVKGKGKLKTYWVGGDEDLVAPLPPPSVPFAGLANKDMDPLSERDEDDAVNGDNGNGNMNDSLPNHFTVHHPDTLSIDAGSVHSNNHGTLHKQASSRDALTTSHDTCATSMLSSSTRSSDSSSTGSSPEKDPFVQVHRKLKGSNTIIQMDGSVLKLREVDPE
jgi:serine/threonine protein kinase/ABC-type phosphate/phosphonate transport system substrate-binding protein